MILGMIVRMDKTGLGNQTRELAEMLKPSKILIIDSRPFKHENEQFPEWYKDFPVQMISHGFPSSREKNWILAGIDTLLTCEIPYGYEIIAAAKHRGIKTFIQYNYEFLDYLHDKRIPMPTKLISPSSWGVEEVENVLKVKPVILRPPIDTERFKEARLRNAQRTSKRRFLHIQGAKAIHDRNGTETLLKAIQLTKSDFEIVIKSQGAPDETLMDPRIVYDNGNPENNEALYYDFDAVIMPRRYGGLCLPMNESLAAGLPVIMTDIEPNRDLLPSKWLIPAHKIGDFMTRTMIDIYEADAQAIADKIDEICEMSDSDLLVEKFAAGKIADDNFSRESLVNKYKEVLGD